MNDKQDTLKKFIVSIEETATGTVIVYAKDEEEAEKKAKERYEKGLVDIDTLVDKQMMIMDESGEETDWYSYY